MSVDVNKNLITEFHQVVMVERRLDEVAQYMRDPLTDLNSTGKSETVQHVQQSLSSYFSAFPDLQSTIEDVTGERDLVVCRVKLSGTHQGDFMGAPPTGKPISVSAMYVFRLADKQIVERWEWVDRMGIRTQLGIQN
ncbi:MAG: ester cyclase [Chloroflexi bacterium]|nr:ester cyclase [Chloroflexota bacterium]